MKDVILYAREIVAGWLLNAAMNVAPKRMSYHIAKGLHVEMQAYADFLKGDLSYDSKR